MKLNVIFTVVSIVILQGCMQKEETERIDVGFVDLAVFAGDAKDIDLTQLGHSFSFIPLETNDMSLLAGMQKKILTSHDHFFIDSRSEIYRFTREGLFLNKIGKIGRGPDEYPSMVDYDVSPDGKTLGVLTTERVLLFDLEGSLLSSFSIERGSQKIAITNDVIVAYADHYFSELGGYSYCFYDYTGKRIDCLPSKHQIRGDVQAGSWFDNSALFYKSEGKLYTKELMSDTIFTVAGLELHPHYILSSGAYRFTPEARAQALPAREYVMVHKVFTINNLMVVLYSFEGNGILTFHEMNKPDGLNVVARRGILDDMFSGAPINRGLFSYSEADNSLMFLISSELYLNYLDRIGATVHEGSNNTFEIDEMSNPVVVKFNLKDQIAD